MSFDLWSNLKRFFGFQFVKGVCKPEIPWECGRSRLSHRIVRRSIPSDGIGHQGAIADGVVTERRSGSVRVSSACQLTDRAIRIGRAVAASIDAKVLLSGGIVGRCRTAVERVDELRLGSCVRVVS